MPLYFKSSSIGRVGLVCALFGLFLAKAALRQTAAVSSMPSPQAQYGDALGGDPGPGMLAGSDHAMYLNVFPGNPKEPAPNMLTPVMDPAWQLNTFNGAEATKAVEGAALKVNITKGGTLNWHVSCGIKVTGLKEGANYFLTGRVRADSTAPLNVLIIPESFPGRNNGLAQTLKPKPEWRSFRLFFRARGTLGE